MQKTLDAEMKQLRSSGLGVEVKKAQPVTNEKNGDDIYFSVVQLMIKIQGHYFTLFFT